MRRKYIARRQAEREEALKSSQKMRPENEQTAPEEEIKDKEITQQNSESLSSTNQVNNGKSRVHRDSTKECLSPNSIFRIKSKYVHQVIDQYLPKTRLLKLAFYSKRLQSLSDLTIEDYEVYHILKNNQYVKFSLSERKLDSSLIIMKNIFELTKSNLLFANHSEINVPVPIVAMIQLKTSEIVAATMSSLLIIEFSERRNTFDIKSEIKIDTNGAIINLIDLGNKLLLCATIMRSFVVDLERGEITFDIPGSFPIALNDGRIAYIYEENFLRIIKLNEVSETEEIRIVRENIRPGEDTKKMNKICSGIQLRSGNILLASYDQTINEYNIKTKKCIQVIQTDISFIETITELKDLRIAITAEDNGNIYIINRNKNDSVLKLSGHIKTVIKLLQLDNEQLISGSWDGKVKIWYKLPSGSFNCAMTLYLFSDFIRDLIFMHDGRILITGDDKTLRAFGVKNYIGNFSIEFIPEDKRNKVKCFQLIDNRIKEI